MQSLALLVRCVGLLLLVVAVRRRQRTDGEALAAFTIGYGVLRYSPNPIACVIDSTKVGADTRVITGIPRMAPVVGSIDEAFEKAKKLQ